MQGSQISGRQKSIVEELIEKGSDLKTVIQGQIVDNALEAGDYARPILFVGVPANHTSCR